MIERGKDKPDNADKRNEFLGVGRSQARSQESRLTGWAARLACCMESHTPETRNGQRLVQDVSPAGQPCYRLRESSGFSTNSTGAWQHTHGPGATVLIAQISQ